MVWCFVPYPELSGNLILENGKWNHELPGENPNETVIDMEPSNQFEDTNRVRPTVGPGPQAIPLLTVPPC